MLCFSDYEYSKLIDDETIEKVYSEPVGIRGVDPGKSLSFPDKGHIRACTAFPGADIYYEVECLGSSRKQRGKGRKRVHMDHVYTFRIVRDPRPGRPFSTG